MNSQQFSTLIEYWDRLSGFRAQELGDEMLSTEQRLLFCKTFEDWPEEEIRRAIERFWMPYSKAIIQRSSQDDDELLHGILFKLFIEEVEHSKTRGELKRLKMKSDEQ
jgi:hypothetical protein